jgi:hypothetical protein
LDEFERFEHLVRMLKVRTLSALRSPLSALRSPLSYDLLTVVLHEMGHVLGREHQVADELMDAILQPGEWHLPELDALLAGW